MLSPSLARRCLALCVVVSFPIAGCAMKGDVRRVEAEVSELRVQSALGDSAGAALLAGIIRELQQLQAESRSYLDSLRTELADVRAMSADLRGTTRDIQRQLATIQELTGLTQARLDQLEARLDRYSEARAQPEVDAPTAGDDAENLFEIGRRQLDGGGLQTARDAFQHIVAQYPAHPRAADALFWLGETFLRGREADSAESYFLRLVDNHPSSRLAAEALYKVGLLAEQQDDHERAREFYRRVVDEYPESSAAALAREKLRDTSS
jgi:tol-pal system protein YbgF